MAPRQPAPLAPPPIARRASLAAAGLLLSAPSLRAQPAPKAGLLITGQSNAGFFLADGGIWTLNEGLAALLGTERAWFDPKLEGIRRLDGYALGQGMHRDPEMATTYGGTPLWAPGDARPFLAHRADVPPAQWQPGAAGQSLNRFIRTLLTDRDRAECLGILWLHTEDDTRLKRRADIATHAAAIRRHLALIRAAFGRPATGATALPAYGWAPIPYGDSAEGHWAVRAALAQVVAYPAQNFHIAMPQTADSEPRGGRDWSHRDAADLLLFSQRAAFAIARHQREQRGLPPTTLAGAGPRISGVSAASATTTLVSVAHDKGRALHLSRPGRDGRGWTVFDDGATRAVSAAEPRGTDGILLRHAAASGQRAVGYCLFGEQLGRGNAVMDDWSRQAALPAGLNAAWRIDLPLQATLTPVAADA